MKQYLLYLCAASLLFSCSKSDETSPDDGADGKMHFAADIPAKEDDWGRATRGPIIDNNSISDFGAFCFHTDRSKWDDVSATAKPNKMFNIQVTRTPATNDWVYTPPVAWDGGDMAYFTFFGYAPYATPDNGITAPASAAVEGTPSLGFVVGDEVTKQVDLLVAKPVYNTAPVDKVKMQFAHALSCICFKAYSLVPGVTVSKIQITGVKYKGDLTLDGSWNSAAETKDFALTYTTPIALPENAKTTDTATDLSADPNGFFLLPQDLKSNTTAKIIFTFTIAGGAEITKEYVIKEAWEKSKRITYIVDLTTNLEEPLIVTKVSITDWAMGTKESGDGDGVANFAELKYDENGTISDGGTWVQNTETRIEMHPTSALQAWNTKADGSGDYYGKGDMIKLKGNTTLYAVDNTVTINGMRWLRGNLSGTAGSDAGYYTEGNPSQYGMFFKWGDSWVYQRESNDTDGMAGDKTHYASTEPKISSSQGGYDYTGLSGGRASGDPCKKLGENFMTPTGVQCSTLIHIGNKTDSYRDVAGCFFGANAAACNNNTIAPGCIFIPFAGQRSYTDGTLNEEKTAGSYCVSTASSRDASRAKYFLLFSTNITASVENPRGNGFSVRCVSTDVNIGGVNWTTANLEGVAGGATGHKMATEPHSYGNFFKWGSAFVYQRESSTSDGGGWGGATTGAATAPAASSTGGTGYDYVGLSGGTNPGDPCKQLGANYKTPTGKQWQDLINSGTIWGNYNNIPGRFFGTKAGSCGNTTLQDGCIFIPGAGYRNYNNGSNSGSMGGDYWSSSVNDSDRGRDCFFAVSQIKLFNTSRGTGMSVRCVRDDI